MRWFCTLKGFQRNGRVKETRKLYSTSAKTSLDRQNEVFNKELKRQHSEVGRIEKIEVKYFGKPESCQLLMNKSISTPYNVAQHINDWVVQRSALALINKQTLWDMHRPLEKDCELQLLTFNDADPFHVNKTFWRTCSFVLGALIQGAFNDHVEVTLHSFPSPQIVSGSFVYDASLSLPDWQPTLEELRSLSAQVVRLSHKALPIERLEVSEEIAKEVFIDNRFKLQQIPDIAKNFGGRVILYRVGSHIDISKGPMVGDTSFIGRCSITAVHQIKKDGLSLYRFQGVALPKGVLLNHFAFKILEERAAKLNQHHSSGNYGTKIEALV